MKRMIITMIMLLIFISAYAKGITELFHKTEEYVDMEQFSGDWYVISLIPIPSGKGALAMGIIENKGNKNAKS